MFQSFTHTPFARMVASIVIVTFITMIPAQSGYAQVLAQLPAPGQMVQPSPAMSPALMMGLKVDLKDPFNFYFIMDKGEVSKNDAETQAEYQRLIKYFMASLTTPSKDMWVNLSPIESDRVITDALATTDMGADMLAQDYLLKQFTASLMYPEDAVGQEFWRKIYEKAYNEFGTTDIPVDTFNKVWITADKAEIYQKDDSALLVDSHLKVMLEQDFMAIEQNKEQFGNAGQVEAEVDGARKIASDIVREVIVPIIEKEVNEGGNFARVRQIYHSMILATWFKKTLREGLLGQVYADKNKVAGVEGQDQQAREKVYQQYLEAYKVGVFNYIKEEADPMTQEVTPRKYFSGGLVGIDPAKITPIPKAKAQEKVRKSSARWKNTLMGVATFFVMAGSMMGFSSANAQTTVPDSLPGQNQISIVAQQGDQDTTKINTTAFSSERVQGIKDVLKANGVNVDDNLKPVTGNAQSVVKDLKGNVTQLEVEAANLTESNIDANNDFNVADSTITAAADEEIANLNKSLEERVAETQAAADKKIEEQQKIKTELESNLKKAPAYSAIETGLKGKIGDVQKEITSIIDSTNRLIGNLKDTTNQKIAVIKNEATKKADSILNERAKVNALYSRSLKQAMADLQATQDAIKVLEGQPLAVTNNLTPKQLEVLDLNQRLVSLNDTIAKVQEVVKKFEGKTGKKKVAKRKAQEKLEQAFLADSEDLLKQLEVSRDSINGLAEQEAVNEQIKRLAEQRQTMYDLFQVNVGDSTYEQDLQNAVIKVQGINDQILAIKDPKPVKDTLVIVNPDSTWTLEQVTPAGDTTVIEKGNLSQDTTSMSPEQIKAEINKIKRIKNNLPGGSVERKAFSERQKALQKNLYDKNKQAKASEKVRDNRKKVKEIKAKQHDLKVERDSIIKNNGDTTAIDRTLKSMDGQIKSLEGNNRNILKDTIVAQSDTLAGHLTDLKQEIKADTATILETNDPIKIEQKTNDARDTLRYMKSLLPVVKDTTPVVVRVVKQKADRAVNKVIKPVVTKTPVIEPVTKGSEKGDVTKPGDQTTVAPTGAEQPAPVVETPKDTVQSSGAETGVTPVEIEKQAQPQEIGKDVGVGNGIVYGISLVVVMSLIAGYAIRKAKKAGEAEKKTEPVLEPETPELKPVLTGVEKLAADINVMPAESRAELMEFLGVQQPDQIMDAYQSLIGDIGTLNSSAADIGAQISVLEQAREKEARKTGKEGVADELIQVYQPLDAQVDKQKQLDELINLLASASIAGIGGERSAWIDHWSGQVKELNENMLRNSRAGEQDAWRQFFFLPLVNRLYEAVNMEDTSNLGSVLIADLGLKLDALNKQLDETRAKIKFVEEFADEFASAAVSEKPAQPKASDATPPKGPEDKGPDTQAPETKPDVTPSELPAGETSELELGAESAVLGEVKLATPEEKQQFVGDVNEAADLITQAVDLERKADLLTNIEEKSDQYQDEIDLIRAQLAPYGLDPDMGVTESVAYDELVMAINQVQNVVESVKDINASVPEVDKRSTVVRGSLAKGLAGIYGRAIKKLDDLPPAQKEDVMSMPEINYIEVGSVMAFLFDGTIDANYVGAWLDRIVSMAEQWKADGKNVGSAEFFDQVLSDNVTDVQKFELPWFEATLRSLSASKQEVDRLLGVIFNPAPAAEPEQEVTDTPEAAAESQPVETPAEDQQKLARPRLVFEKNDHTDPVQSKIAYDLETALEHLTPEQLARILEGADTLEGVLGEEGARAIDPIADPKIDLNAAIAASDKEWSLAHPDREAAMQVKEMLEAFLNYDYEVSVYAATKDFIVSLGYKDLTYDPKAAQEMQGEISAEFNKLRDPKTYTLRVPVEMKPVMALYNAARSLPEAYREKMWQSFLNGLTAYESSRKEKRPSDRVAINNANESIRSGINLLLTLKSDAEAFGSLAGYMADYIQSIYEELMAAEMIRKEDVAVLKQEADQRIRRIIDKIDAAVELPLQMDEPTTAAPVKEEAPVIDGAKPAADQITSLAKEDKEALVSLIKWGHEADIIAQITGKKEIDVNAVEAQFTSSPVTNQTGVFRKVETALKFLIGKNLDQRKQALELAFNEEKTALGDTIAANEGTKKEVYQAVLQDLEKSIDVIRKGFVDNAGLENVGGINLSEEHLTMSIKVDGAGMPLPVQFQDAAMSNIQGLSPIIREIAPLVTSRVPALAELLTP